MSFPPHHISQNWISCLLDDYEYSLTAQEEIDAPHCRGITPNPIEACAAPNHDLSENQGYSRLLIEQYQIDARNNPLLAKSLAGVFSEVPLMSQPDTSIDNFSMANTVEGEYGDVMVESGNYHDSSPPHPPPKSLVPCSIPISNGEKTHACTHCGKLFDRWSRARDCAYKALDQAPHHCEGRCGNVACNFATSSEQLLNEHLNPRSMACPLCLVITSKKNLARHQKETCVNGNFAANAHS